MLYAVSHVKVHIKYSCHARRLQKPQVSNVTLFASSKSALCSLYSPAFWDECVAKSAFHISQRKINFSDAP